MPGWCLVLLLLAHQAPLGGSEPFEVIFPSSVLSCDEACWNEGTLVLQFQLHLHGSFRTQKHLWSFRVSLQDAMSPSAARCSLGPSEPLPIDSHCQETHGIGSLSCMVDLNRVVEGRYKVNVSFFSSAVSPSLYLGAQSHDLLVLRIPHVVIVKPRPEADHAMKGQEAEFQTEFTVHTDTTSRFLRIYAVEILVGDMVVHRESDKLEDGGISSRQMLYPQHVRLKHELKVPPGCHNFSFTLNSTALAFSNMQQQVFNHHQTKSFKVCFGLRRDIRVSLTPRVELFCSNIFCSCARDGSCYNDTQCKSEIHSADVFDIIGQAIMTACRFNRGDFSSLAGDSSPFSDIQIFVVNLPWRGDKKRHTAKLLETVGFSSICFPNVTLVQDISLKDLIEQGWVSSEGVRLMMQMDWIKEKALPSYIARAMDHLKTLEEALRAGRKLVGIFEDDLMLQDEPGRIKSRIAGALQELPPSADMLFLEYCFENCSKLCSKSSKFQHISRAHRPYCSGAIIFTEQGARNVLRLCRPIFGAIDNMLPMLIERGHLEAYVLNTPAFYQDEYWGSDVARNVLEASRQGGKPFLRLHRPIVSHCAEYQSSSSIWSQMNRYIVVPVVGNGSTDNSYIHHVYLRGQQDSSASECVKSPHGDLLLLSDQEARELLRFPVCSQVRSVQLCLITQFSLIPTKIEMLCDGAGRSDCLIEGHESLFLASCEGRWSTTFVLPPINECYGSRWCHLVTLNKSAMWDKTFPGPPVWITFLFVHPRAEDRTVCFLTFGEEGGAEEVWLKEDVQTWGARRSEEGLVELVYSRQVDGDPFLLQVPACYAVSEMRAMLLEEAIERFRMPLVRFKLFVFCSLESFRAGRCRNVAREKLREQEDRLGGSLASEWEDVEETLAVWWTEVNFVREHSSSRIQSRTPPVNV